MTDPPIIESQIIALPNPLYTMVNTNEVHLLHLYCLHLALVGSTISIQTEVNSTISLVLVGKGNACSKRHLDGTGFNNQGQKFF